MAEFRSDLADDLAAVGAVEMAEVAFNKALCKYLGCGDEITAAVGAVPGVENFGALAVDL